ncbi:hypothetical protein C8R44DRAFT_728766 [Mycena epipterygia]|nr:hypothetical protein C8R44DRAFT_728766 [Mycena epipterygia]
MTGICLVPQHNLRGKVPGAWSAPGALLYIYIFMFVANYTDSGAGQSDGAGGGDQEAIKVAMLWIPGLNNSLTPLIGPPSAFRTSDDMGSSIKYVWLNQHLQEVVPRWMSPSIAYRAKNKGGGSMRGSSPIVMAYTSHPSFYEKYFSATITAAQAATRTTSEDSSSSRTRFNKQVKSSNAPIVSEISGASV